MDLSKMAEALGFDEPEFKEMLQLFVDTTRSDLGKLQSALDQANAETAMEASHSIKGAARSFGFDDIAGGAENIELRARRNDLDDLELDLLRAKLEEIAEALKQR
jgi:HPt (histidine-containing phosphotransfer) domain-containing protein